MNEHLYYELLADGTIGRSTNDAAWAEELGLTHETDERIVYAQNGKCYLESECPQYVPTFADYDSAMEAHLDAEKAERGYTKREPSDYAGSTNHRWAQDALDWISHRDAVITYGLDVVNRAKRGEPVPTLEEFKAALPRISWTIQLVLALCLSFALPTFGEVVKMTPLPTFVAGTNATLAAAKAYTDEHSGGGGGVTPATVTNVANARIDAKVAPWAMAGQPQPTGSITNVFTNGVSAVTNGVARIAIPTAATFASDFAEKATEGIVLDLSETVAQWENYWTGERVRLSVTNYYGNTSGELPRLRIEELDHSVTNSGSVTNIYRVVWDETTRQTNYMAVTDAKVNSISGTVMTASWRQTNAQLANKAPRAWGDVTSGGEAAPPNVVWHTAPNTVFAGGTEYAHVAVGDGTICVLVDKGASVFTEGAEGQFRFKDQTGQNYFGFDVRESYTLGCRTDGISVSPQNIVSLTYDLTSADNPEVLVCTNLSEGVWSVATVTWETDPPVGTKICYINSTVNGAFYQAQMHYAGGSKFLTNMMADLQGGIAATNETGIGTATKLPIYPAITSTGVVWRVKWGN